MRSALYIGYQEFLSSNSYSFCKLDFGTHTESPLNLSIQIWEYIQPKYHLVFSNFICTHGHRTNPLPEQENEQKSVSIFYCSAVLLDPCTEKESLSPFYIAYLILFNHHSSIKLALKPPFFESLFLGLAYIDQHMIKFPTRK